MVKTLTDQLKDAVAESGLSVYEIAKATGIPQPVLHRFVAGDRPTIRLDTAEKLATYFAMRLTVPKRPKA
jgi:plasmid maintenance system antidote protein VapI